RVVGRADGDLGGDVFSASRSRGDGLSDALAAADLAEVFANADGARVCDAGSDWAEAAGAGHVGLGRGAALFHGVFPPAGGVRHVVVQRGGRLLRGGVVRRGGVSHGEERPGRGRLGRVRGDAAVLYRMAG